MHAAALALVLGTVAGCAALVALRSPGGGQDGLGMLRNFALCFGAALCLGRVWGAVVGVVSLVSYTGLCLFIGVDSAGRIADWALVLSPSTSSLQGLLALLILVVGCVFYCVGPSRSQARSGNDNPSLSG